jgi:molybdopterin-synthase adenylyltransferase
MFRPRIKLELRPVRFADGRIRIGEIKGIVNTVIDPAGWMWALLDALDGTRTIEQVVADVVHAFPHRPTVDVYAAVGDLVLAGYVENAAEPVPEGLSAAELERYGRGRLLLRWMDRTPRSTSWDTQLLLRQARLVVVGVGGVGSTAALALVMSGVGHVHCVEPDMVELSNLNRQVLFTERDIGRAKVDVAVERLSAHNRDVAITGERLVVDDPAVLRGLAARFDVVVLAADQPSEIRSWANQACLETGTAWVHGGYHGPQVSIGLYRPGDGPCHDCLYAERDVWEATRPPRTAWSPGVGIPRPHAVNAVTAGIAGNLAAHAAMSLITGVPALRTNCQYGYNLVTLHHARVIGPIEPSPRCPTCGPRRQSL